MYYYVLLKLTLMRITFLLYDAPSKEKKKMKKKNLNVELATAEH